MHKFHGQEKFTKLEHMNAQLKYSKPVIVHCGEKVDSSNGSKTTSINEHYPYVEIKYSRTRSSRKVKGMVSNI